MPASKRSFSAPRRLAMLAVLALALVLPTGCFETRFLPAQIPPAGASANALVGPSGGTISIGDLHVVVPANAVSTDTMITIRVEDASHTPFAAYSPIVRLEPAGLVLAAPVEVRIPFQGDPGLANAYVAMDGRAYAPFATEVQGDVAVTHLSALTTAFVGTACTGSSCLCEPIGSLDLLVVIDDSASMAEEHALLREQFPILLRGLATGDLDGDGVQDVAAFGDVRVGITTSDLGVGSVAGIPGCAMGSGDDGVLRNAPGPTADASCTTATYSPAYAPYVSSMSSNLDGFIAQISCESAVGNSGCGFEQQLEAGLLALSPNAPTSYTAPGWTVPAFPEGRMGQGDLANSGFLRDGSLLAVVFITDEDDCSTRDSHLFDPADPRFAAADLNLRCTLFPEQLLTVSSIADGLLGLRRRPEDVVVGAIAGIPSGIATSDLGAVLANPAMSPQVDPAMPTRLVPACTSMNGTADPAQRIVQTMQAIETAGGQAVVHSICDPSFAAFTSDLAHTLARRAGGGC